MFDEHKGWEFLTEDDMNIGFDDRYFRTPDGYCRYEASDGSWGEKYPDGRAVYHGADGSYGERDCNGRISFYDSYGNNFTNFGGDFDSMANAASAVADAMRAKLEMEEFEALEKRRAKRAEKFSFYSQIVSNFCVRNKKTLGISFLIICLLFSVFTCYSIQRRKIPIPFSSESLYGLTYAEATQKLKEAGFTNIKTKEVSDLTISREAEENRISEVKLLVRKSFKAGKSYPSNFPITLVYHTIELYKAPISSKEAKGMNYVYVAEMFKNAGFTNVTVQEDTGLLTGMLNREDEIKSLTINGEKFDSNDKFRLDADVVIVYHSSK